MNTRLLQPYQFSLSTLLLLVGTVCVCARFVPGIVRDLIDIYHLLFG